MNVVVSLLALIGLVIASYILYKRKSKKKMSCPLHGKCESVTQSKWGKVLGFHNDFLGVLYYCFVIVLGLLSFRYVLISVTGLGLMFSLYLFYVQSRILREYCFYCLISALVTLLMFGFAWF
jgi:uncharacterized membrane protein